MLPPLEQGGMTSFLLQLMPSVAPSLGLLLATKPSLRVFFSHAVISEPRVYVEMGTVLVSSCFKS